MPLFLLYPIFQARKLTQRVPIIFFVLLVLGILIAWLKVPSRYAAPYDFFAFFVCLIWVMEMDSNLKSGRKELPSPQSYIYVALIVAFLLKPSTDRHKVIQLRDKDMIFAQDDKVERVDRQGLDVTFEDAWSGSGYYWGFDDSKERGGTVTSDDVYWTGGVTLITGDEVARRISVWSNSKPRYVFIGAPRGGVKPTPLR